MSDYIDETHEDVHRKFEWSEDDLGQIHALALNRPHVLGGVCKVLGMHLVTQWFTSDRTVDLWSVTPADGPTFSGTMRDVGAYVLGYTVAWRGQRARARGRLRNIQQELEKMMERL